MKKSKIDWYYLDQVGILRLLVLALCCIPVSVFASGSDDFFVTRTSSAKSEQLHASFQFGDIYPTREVARLVVAQRMRNPDTTYISVSDFNKASFISGTEGATEHLSR